MKKENYRVYYVLICTLIVLIGVCSFFFNYFYNMRSEKIALNDVSIKTNGTISANVKLFSSSFFTSTDAENSYLLSLIDNVSPHFNYDVTFSSNVSGDYSYYIIGSLIVDDGENQVKSDLYKSELYSNTLDGSVLNISDTFDIDVDEYVNKVKNEITDANLNSKLEFKVVINYSFLNDDISRYISDSKELYVDIPITEITTISLSDDIEETRKESNINNFEDNGIYVVICMEFIGAIIIFLLLIVLLYKRIAGVMTPYERTLKDLLVIYDDLIVYLKKIPILDDDQNVLFVESMDDLVNTSKTTNGPINFYEVVRGREAVFIVFDDETSYVYKLSSKKIKK